MSPIKRFGFGPNSQKTQQAQQGQQAQQPKKSKKSKSSSAQEDNGWSAIKNEKREVALKRLKALGYQESVQKGSHLKLFHPAKNVTKTFSAHGGGNIDRGQLRDLLEAIGCSAEDYFNATKK